MDTNRQPKSPWKTFIPVISNDIIIENSRIQVCGKEVIL